MSTDHRFRPQRIMGGVVVQSGVDLRPRSMRPILEPSMRPFRAVVVSTRVVGEDGNLRGVSVECDVLLVRYQYAIRNVPVLQRQHGINNVHDLWIPRPSTRVVSGDTSQPLNLDRTHSRRGTEVGAGTPFADADGDMVLVDFIESNPDYPIVIGALAHERSNRVVRTGDGWREGESDTRGNPRRDEYYTHHYGSELRINEQGDVLIDTVGAYSDPATEDASGAGGQVRVRVKDGERLTIAIGDDEDVLEVYKDGSQLKVDIGEGADEQLVLGNRLSDFIRDEIATKVNNFIGTFNGHIHSGGTIMGNTGAPSTTFADTIANLPADALSDLARTKRS